jgi:hypothetical protein
MILRVYAMWNQSKRILYILLSIYVPQVILALVSGGIYSNPNTYLSGISPAKLKSHMWPLLHPFSPVTVVQVLDISFCNASMSNASFHLVLAIITLGIVLGVMLLMLAVISTLKESFVLYKATNQWQPNHYMQLFVRDGILYFVV